MVRASKVPGLGAVPRAEERVAEPGNSNPRPRASLGAARGCAIFAAGGTDGAAAGAGIDAAAPGTTAIPVASSPFAIPMSALGSTAASPTLGPRNFHVQVARPQTFFRYHKTPL